MSGTKALATIKSRVAWIFEDDFDIDQIIGVANLKVHDVDELSALAMNRFDPNFRAVVQTGDVLVAGKNFGYGHPHAGAMRAMRYLGIRAVIAESFFSSYWVGEIGYGFIQVVCPGITNNLRRWDEIIIDFEAGAIQLTRQARTLDIKPYSERELEILSAGGLRKLLARSGEPSVDVTKA
jgi:3-isopropylmalate/(R)-2-methylmalate dehydratase small subunit